MLYKGIKIKGTYFLGLTGDTVLNEEYADYDGFYYIEKDKIIVEIKNIFGKIPVSIPIRNIKNLIDYETRKDFVNFFLDSFSFYSTIRLPNIIDDDFVNSVDEQLIEEINEQIKCMVRKCGIESCKMCGYTDDIDSFKQPSINHSYYD